MRAYKQVNMKIQRWPLAEGQNQGGLHGGGNASTTSGRIVRILSLCSVAGTEGIEPRKLRQEQRQKQDPRGPAPNIWPPQLKRLALPLPRGKNAQLSPGLAIVDHDPDSPSISAASWVAFSPPSDTSHATLSLFLFVRVPRHTRSRERVRGESHNTLKTLHNTNVWRHLI